MHSCAMTSVPHASVQHEQDLPFAWALAHGLRPQKKKEGGGGGLTGELGEPTSARLRCSL